VTRAAAATWAPRRPSRPRLGRDRRVARRRAGSAAAATAAHDHALESAEHSLAGDPIAG
jgi:hypothetical protein